MSEPGGDPSSGISSGDALILPERHPACRRREARPGFRTERENLCCVTPNGVKGEAASGSNREGESTDAERRGGAARSSVEGSVMEPERRGCVVQPWPSANRQRKEPMDEAKPFLIPKREVWEAFKRVKANQGAAGVDGQSIAEFEAVYRTTSTSSGTDCRQGATFLRRCGGSIFRRRMVGRDRWAFQRLPTASLRR